MSEFKPSNMLQRYLNTENRNIYDIVGALMGYINADPMFKTNEFEQALRYVQSQGVSKEELFAPFDKNIKYEEDPSKWDEEYYSYARVYLKENFCEKRIAHVKEVAHKLYPVIKDIERKETNITQKKDKSQQMNPRNGVRTIIAVVVVISLAILLASLIRKQ